jgi:hypothetical protein
LAAREKGRKVMYNFQTELVKLSAEINARNMRMAAMANGPGSARNHGCSDVGF